LRAVTNKKERVTQIDLLLPQAEAIHTKLKEAYAVLETPEIKNIIEGERLKTRFKHVDKRVADTKKIYDAIILRVAKKIEALQNEKAGKSVSTKSSIAGGGSKKHETTSTIATLVSFEDAMKDPGKYHLILRPEEGYTWASDDTNNYAVKLKDSTEDVPALSYDELSKNFDKYNVDLVPQP